MTFRLHQDVAVVEYRDGQPVRPEDAPSGCVTQAGSVYTMARRDDGAVGRFWTEQGWGAWDGSQHLRIVPLCCRCEKPITGIPVTAGDDPLGRQWCSGECLDAAAEASYEQRYQPGVAT